MTTKWGVIYAYDFEGKFIAYHIMPIVLIGKEWVPTEAHIMSEDCQCGPFLCHGRGGWPMWSHFDPNHPGGMNEEEFRQASKEAEQEWESMQRLEIEAEKAAKII